MVKVQVDALKSALGMVDEATYSARAAVKASIDDVLAIPVDGAYVKSSHGYTQVNRYVANTGQRPMYDPGLGRALLPEERAGHGWPEGLKEAAVGWRTIAGRLDEALTSAAATAKMPIYSEGVRNARHASRELQVLAAKILDDVPQKLDDPAKGINSFERSFLTDRLGAVHAATVDASTAIRREVDVISAAADMGLLA